MQWNSINVHTLYFLGIIQCGSLKCPEGTDTCEIRVSSSTDDPKKIETLAQCLENGKQLMHILYNCLHKLISILFLGTLVDSNSQIHDNPTGVAFTSTYQWSRCDNCTELANNITETVNAQMRNLQIDLNQMYKNLQNNLQNMFNF